MNDDRDSHIENLPKNNPEEPSTNCSKNNNKETPDPFDVEALRLSQDFEKDLGVNKALLTVPVRKPDKTWFVRVHPDEEYRLQTAVLELKEERETYLIAPNLWSELSTEATFTPKVLFTAVNRQGVLFLWSIRLPGSDGRRDDWNASALEGATMGMKGWVRVTANMSLGAYEVCEATGHIPEPTWPDESFQALIKIAFKDRLINELDHPVLKRLRGEE